MVVAWPRLLPKNIFEVVAHLPLGRKTYKLTGICDEVIYAQVTGAKFDCVFYDMIPEIKRLSVTCYDIRTKVKS